MTEPVPQPFVIFDLDNTVVDSLGIKPQRDRRDWQVVYRLIPSLRAFPGIVDAWRTLTSAGTHVAVVTHAPRTYATKVLSHLGLVPDSLVAYHDLEDKTKPSPFGYKKAIASVQSSYGIAVGDDPNDLIAADRLPCPAVVAGWARECPITEAEAAAHGWHYLRSPAELPALLGSLRPPPNPAGAA